jgi:hypothetical protein
MILQHAFCEMENWLPLHRKNDIVGKSTITVSQNMPFLLA